MGEFLELRQGKAESVVIIKNVGKLLASHRYDPLSLLSSDPGEVRGELVVQDLPTVQR